MINTGAADGGLTDWASLLDSPDEFNIDFVNDPVATNDFGASFSIDDLEQYLLNDDLSRDQRGEEQFNPLPDDFFADIHLGSPRGSWLESDPSKDLSNSPDSVVIGAEEDEKENGDDSSEKIGGAQGIENSGDGDGEIDDPSEKKRKRQIRNRDAAVRSRERKKMYVKDLELKSKYYEAECKRLGSLLQFCMSENQALKLSLLSGKACDASTSMQESAVLLLESLLLGSLLGRLGIIYLVILHSLFRPVEASLPEEMVGEEEWERMAPRKEVMELHRMGAFHLFMMGKECKAARPRMRLMPPSSPVICC